MMMIFLEKKIVCHYQLSIVLKKIKELLVLIRINNKNLLQKVNGRLLMKNKKLSLSKLLRFLNQELNRMLKCSLLRKNFHIYLPENHIWESLLILSQSKLIRKKIMFTLMLKIRIQYGLKTKEITFITETIISQLLMPILKL
jgi:hypothetical protein